ncbi:MAG TPA: HEAT repeat domain-containing protein [Pirellulaceae bacterium]|nr:HEAT repeat domain-containing protein [Pirellulaceae bacterium]
MFGAIREWLTTRKLNRLIAALEDSFQCEDVAKELGALGDRRAVLPLVQALEHERYGRNYRAIIAALAALQDPRAAEALVAGYNEVDHETKEVIRRVLSRTGEEGYCTLVGALADHEEKVRISAASLLGELGGPIRARAVKALTPLLHDSSKYVRGAALGALQALGWQPATATERAAAAVAAGDFGAAADQGPASLPLLEREFMSHHQSEWPLKLTIAEAVLKVDGNLAAKLVMQLLFRENLKWVDWLALADEAARFRDDRVFAAILAALQDPEMRRKAALMLGKIRDPRAVEPLVAAVLALASYNSDAEVIAEALRELGDRRALNALMAQFRRGGQVERPIVVKVIDMLGWEPEAEEDRTLLTAERLHLQVGAAIALLQIASNDSREREMEELLRTRAGEMTSEDLKALTLLPPMVTRTEIDHDDDHNHSGILRSYELRTDNSHVIALAAAELHRRNRSATG